MDSQVSRKAYRAIITSAQLMHTGGYRAVSPTFGSEAAAQQWADDFVNKSWNRPGFARQRFHISIDGK